MRGAPTAIAHMHLTCMLWRASCASCASCLWCLLSRVSPTHAIRVGGVCHQLVSPTYLYLCHQPVCHRPPPPLSPVRGGNLDPGPWNLDTGPWTPSSLTGCATGSWTLDPGPPSSLTECVAHLTFMRAQLCSTVCQDHDDSCKGWAKDSQCEDNKAFMYRACPASCGICQVLESEGNKDEL